MNNEQNIFTKKDYDQCGRYHNQKLKPYLVLNYLMHNSDEGNAVPIEDIRKYLENTCNINAERRSIYRDIDTINKILWMLNNNSDIDTAEEIIEGDIDNEEKAIVYDKHRKGYFFRQSKYTFNDIKILAECIYSSKFISQPQADKLADIICDLISENQAKKIKHDAIVVDRVKTTNKRVIENISIINDAMSTELDGEPHTPCKIKFKYLKYTINNIKQQAERKHGEFYTVSPYQLIIENGNYYLLAYNDKFKKIITYRVDRMKFPSLTNEEREGEEVFKEIDLKTYTQKVFSMFSGLEERITLHFINPLLDTVIDRFGTKNAVYSQFDKDHIEVVTKVAVSDQFFGWVCGFGKKMKIVSPEPVVKKFTDFLDGIREKY